MEKNKQIDGLFEKLSGFLASFEITFASIAFALMLVDVIAGVIMRRVIRIAFPWGEELARYLMVAGIMAGLGVCARQRTHTRVDLFINLLPGHADRVFLILDDIATLVCYVVLDVLSVFFLKGNRGLGQMSSTLHFPMYWVYYLLIVGFTLAVIEQIYLIYRDHLNAKNKSEQEEN